LDSITKSTLGATIGNITVSAPACADDIALLGESKDTSWYSLFNIMSWLTVSNAFSASTVRSSKSRLNVLYINIVSDAINAVNLQMLNWQQKYVVSSTKYLKSLIFQIL
jgi:hypothetical protein